MSKELIRITEEEEAKSLLYACASRMPSLWSLPFKQMEKTPEEILLKLIESEGSEISQIGSTTIRIQTNTGWYDLNYIEESKTKNESYYTLYKAFGYNSIVGTGVVFKYQPISSEFMWKYLKGQSPKQELINDIFE